MNLPIFQTRDIEAYTQSLANYLPNDQLFGGKNENDTNLRKLLKGLSGTLFNVNGYIKGFTDEVSPLVTEQFLNDWERCVGIPDDCFVVQGRTNEERRVQIIAKLSYMACQVSQDFIDLCALFGAVVTVTPGIEDVSGATAGLTDTEKRFTIVIDTNLEEGNAFPLMFPIFFGNRKASLIECIVGKVIPSNCQVLFNHNG